MPDFKTSEDRRQWIIDNADRYVLGRWVGGRGSRRYERHEVATLKEAEELAADLIRQQPGARFLIYAVAGESDTWVRNIP